MKRREEKRGEERRREERRIEYDDGDEMDSHVSD